MNSAIALEQTPSSMNGVGFPRMALTATFVLVGLIVLYLAIRHIRRHHKTRRHHRY